MKEVANTRLKMLRAVAFAGGTMLVASCSTIRKAPTNPDTACAANGQRSLPGRTRIPLSKPHRQQITRLLPLDRSFRAGRPDLDRRRSAHDGVLRVFDPGDTGPLGRKPTVLGSQVQGYEQHR